MNGLDTHETPGPRVGTFLVHHFGRGLAAKRYRVERYQAKANGDIERIPGPREAHTITRQEVLQMRPRRVEVIICTGMDAEAVELRNPEPDGVQYWGSFATGLFTDRTRNMG